MTLVLVFLKRLILTFCEDFISFKLHLVVMAFDLDSVKARVKPLRTLNPNVASRIVSKREREKLERVSHIIVRLFWNVDDFHKNLKLSNVGIDP